MCDALMIIQVGEAQLPKLLPLLRAYCQFYQVSPTDESLLALSRALIADPAGEGVQLLAVDDHGEPTGFATIYWSWATTIAARLAIMNDLYVTPAARGTGVAQALIQACAAAAANRGAKQLSWQTALDNTRAQRVYDRTGATKSTWHEYQLDL